MSTLTATLHTSLGDVPIELFPNHAPKTVANFVGLAKGTREYSTQNAQGGKTGPFYDGAIFHRIIDGFMIQGGDRLGTGTGGPGYTFADEFHPDLSFNRPYLLAMANAGPGTNGSQFFITVTNTPHLNRRHTIFGEVADASSRAVVDEIATSLGADSLGYISEDGMIAATGQPRENLCTACFTGRYPVELPAEDRLGKGLLELQLPVEFGGVDPTTVGTADLGQDESIDLARTNPDGVSPAGGAAVSPARRHTSN